MLRLVNQLNSSGRDNLYRPVQINGTVKHVTRVRTDIGYSGLTFTRNFGSTQNYTWLGNSHAYLTECESSFDGLAKRYLTTEGVLSTDNIFAEVKANSGFQSNILITHSANVSSWKWYDNHVSLLVNLLRFYTLVQLDEGSKLNTGRYPVYDDGHVKLDMNDTLPLPFASVEFRWPGGRVAENYPIWSHATEYLPQNDEPFIDVRGLTVEEARVVLMMMGSWNRKTNYMLDFSTPKLCEKVNYRYHTYVTEPDTWLDAATDNGGNPVPKSAVIWSAMRKYVQFNRLHNQFFTATSIVSQLMVRPLPDTAESNVWLKYSPMVKLPTFGSIRGRYPFLNQGEASLIQAKALEDWGAIMAKPELIFTYGLLLSSCFCLGVAARFIKTYVFEDNVDDKYDYSAFDAPETFFAACVTEATGLDTPLNGMADVYVTYPELTEVQIITELDAVVSEPNGYNIVDGKLVVRGMPTIGSPYLTYPISPFEQIGPYNGAYQMPKPLRQVRGGSYFSVYDGWKLAWAARICGYDTMISVPGVTNGPMKYYSPNENSWSHLLHTCAVNDTKEILITSFERRNHHFIELPQLMRAGNWQEVSVRITPMDGYVQDAVGNKFRSSGVAGQWVAPLMSGIQVVSAGQLRRFWGAVKRTKQGLAFSGDVQPAVIPGSSKPVMMPTLEVDETTPAEEEQ